MAVGSVLNVLLSLLSRCWFCLVSIVFITLNSFFKRQSVETKRHNDADANIILHCSAVNLAKKIRSKEISAEAVVRAFIGQISRINDNLNAVVEARFDAAIHEAQDVDDLLIQGQEPSLTAAPLLGIPFTVKDSVSINGMCCTVGIPSRKDTRVFEDAEVVKRLRNAGAIPLAVTNVPEDCMHWESSNTIYGRTNNPYDLRRTCGGSSGGEGALIAAGGSVVGVGTDIGGSIRVPALFNGIFGHKPSKLVVPKDGIIFPVYGFLDEMEVCGPLCRYAGDLLPMLKVLSGPKESNSLKLHEEVRLSEVKFYYMKEIKSPLVASLDTEVYQHLMKAVKYLGKKFRTSVHRLDIPEVHDSLQIWFNDLFLPSEGPLMSEDFTNLEGRLNPWLELGKRMLGRSPHTIPAICWAFVEDIRERMGCAEIMSQLSDNQKRLVEERKKLEKTFEDLLGEDGVFLFPTWPIAAPFHNEGLFMPFNIAYAIAFNSIGLPVTQVPMGLNSKGIPMGIQIVGGLNQDRLCIAVALELERAFGGWVPP